MKIRRKNISPVVGITLLFILLAYFSVNSTVQTLVTEMQNTTKNSTLDGKYIFTSSTDKALTNHILNAEILAADRSGNGTVRAATDIGWGESMTGQRLQHEPTFKWMMKSTANSDRKRA